MGDLSAAREALEAFTSAGGNHPSLESAWTEWVRRVSGKELARRMSGRVAGNVVRDITVTRRSPSGRAVEMRVQTDLAEATFAKKRVRGLTGT